MNRKLKALLTALSVVALSAAVLVPFASAGGSSTSSTPRGMMGSPMPSPSFTATMMPTATPSPTPSSTAVPSGWCGGGMWAGSGTWGGTGMWGTGFGMSWLTTNPDAMRAWLQLRTTHQQALRTWYDTYKTDLTSPVAQQALHDLWTTFWTDMKTFYETYANGATWTCPSEGMWAGWGSGGMMGGQGWDAQHMWGTGYGAAWMTAHPRAFGRWLTMRSAQVADTNAWWQLHRADPAATAAQTALDTMRAHHRAQVKSFYMNHHLPVTSSSMRFGAGGWMGLGGMWGGWGW